MMPTHVRHVRCVGGKGQHQSRREMLSGLPVMAFSERKPQVLRYLPAARPELTTENNDYGCHLHFDHDRSLRGYALDGGGCLPARRCRMTFIYVVSVLLTLGLFVYLLYAMFKPEKF
jgi:K+-transporting ATPase KdpF subunit